MADGGNMLPNEWFKNGNDLFLLMSWKLRNRVEELLGTTNRTAATNLDRFAAQEIIGGCIQNRGQLCHLLWLKGDGATFPCRVTLLGNPQLFGHLLLRQTSFLAE